MRRQFFGRSVIILILLFLLPLSCGREREAKELNLEKKISIHRGKEKRIYKGHLRVAVGGMITPREGFAYYKRFLDYISEKIGMPVDFVDRETYKAINELLKSGDIDLAFVCGGPYVEGHSEFGLELLVAPVVRGETGYYAYIIVPEGSSVKELKDLRDKTFAFTDPLSHTGKIVPTYMLRKIGEQPDRFFKKYFYTYAHDKSIKAVALGLVDGASVDSLIYEYMVQKYPSVTASTRVIERSGPYGIPPVVIRPGLDTKLKKRLKEIFLTAHLDEKGREILNGMRIDRFVEIDDSAYDSIRRIKEEINQ